MPRVRRGYSFRRTPGVSETDSVHLLVSLKCKAGANRDCRKTHNNTNTEGNGEEAPSLAIHVLVSTKLNLVFPYRLGKAGRKTRNWTVMSILSTSNSATLSLVLYILKA